jgi:hypothetical protein
MAIESSREWQIDCEIRHLIGEMVQQTITDQGRAKLQDLQRERVQRMHGWWLSRSP